MTTYIGDAGGIAVGAETVYGTEAAAWVVQNPAPSSFGHRVSPIETGILMPKHPSIREYNKFSDGDIVVGYTRKRSRNLFLACLGKLTTQTITFGDGVAPDNAIGLSVAIDFGGLQLKYLAGTVTKLRWDLRSNTSVLQTATMIARGGTIDATPETMTAPDLADVVMDSDLATFTFAAAAIVIKGATIEIDPHATGLDRRGLGSANHKQPLYVGPWDFTATLDCELSSDTGNNTQAVLTSLLGGTAVGDLVMDDWTLKNCYVEGDMPPISAGIIPFSMRARADYITLLTEA